MIPSETLHHWFTSHALDEDDSRACAAIRAGAREFAQVIVDNTPASADQTAALRKVREAMMTANAGRACGGR